MLVALSWVAAAENGQFTARVYVGNYGFTSAEMTIRCTVNGQTA